MTRKAAPKRVWRGTFTLLFVAAGCSSSPRSSVDPRATTTARAAPSARDVVASASASIGAAQVPSAAQVSSTEHVPSTAPTPPAESEDAELAPCARSKTEGYGDWRPAPREVIAALAAMKGSGGVDGWFAKLLGDCMEGMHQPYVEVMVADDANATAIWTTVGSVQWQGRRFITLYNLARMGPTFVGTMDAVELTPRGPVQVIDTCQEDPGSGLGPAGPRVAPPRGWSTLPAEVRQRLCP